MAKEKKGNPYAREMWRMFKLRNGNMCPFCKKDLSLATFEDEQSRREHHLSGLCQACQDEFFGQVEG